MSEVKMAIEAGKRVEQLQGFRYRRQAAQRLLDRVRDGKPVDDYVLSMELKLGAEYDAWMAANGGDPCGVEFKHESAEVWGFVCADASVAGGWRVQRFDANGMMSHLPVATKQGALELLFNERFRRRDPGVADRLCTTRAWAIGTEIAGLLQRLNAQQISQDQFEELKCQVTQQH